MTFPQRFFRLDFAPGSEVGWGRRPKGEIAMNACVRAFSNTAYHLIVAEYAVQDLLIGGHEAVLEAFGIRRGWTVIDYGCGPGRYLEKASALVGPKGQVFAADVNEVAVRCAKGRIRRSGLANVRPVLIRAGRAPIPTGSADLVYALDMFHAVRDPSPFLREIRRMVKPRGRLILEDGHQRRSRTLEKVAASGVWKVVSQSRLAVRCAPISARRPG
jgi:SAM-dependent methyltransferase